MTPLKVGDYVEIIKNSHGGFYSVGETVKIVSFPTNTLVEVEGLFQSYVQVYALTDLEFKYKSPPISTGGVGVPILPIGNSRNSVFWIPKDIPNTPLFCKQVVCECGSDKVGSPKHSNWCPKHEEEK